MLYLFFVITKVGVHFIFYFCFCFTSLPLLVFLLYSGFLQLSKCRLIHTKKNFSLKKIFLNVVDKPVHTVTKFLLSLLFCIHFWLPVFLQNAFLLMSHYRGKPVATVVYAQTVILSYGIINSVFCLLKTSEGLFQCIFIF